MTAAPAELLGRIELFRDLDPPELEALARVSFRREVARGTVIFEAGEEADEVFVVATGKVRIAVSTPEGKELILATLGSGQVFGEMALLDSAPRSASAIAETRVELIGIHRADFQRLLDAHPNISKKLLAMLSRRLRRANARMQSLAYMDVAGRLARYFLDLARDHGQDLGNGWVVVRRPTHADIAHSIGASRETVSRLLGEFEERFGMVNRGKFTYIRKEHLAEP